MKFSRLFLFSTALATAAGMEAAEAPKTLTSDQCLELYDTLAGQGIDAFFQALDAETQGMEYAYDLRRLVNGAFYTAHTSGKFTTLCFALSQDHVERLLRMGLSRDDSVVTVCVNFRRMAPEAVEAVLEAFPDQINERRDAPGDGVHDQLLPLEIACQDLKDKEGRLAKLLLAHGARPTLIRPDAVPPGREWIIERGRNPRFMQD